MKCIKKLNNNNNNFEKTSYTFDITIKPILLQFQKQNNDNRNRKWTTRPVKQNPIIRTNKRKRRTTRDNEPHRWKSIISGAAQITFFFLKLKVARKKLRTWHEQKQRGLAAGGSWVGPVPEKLWRVLWQQLNGSYCILYMIRSLGLYHNPILARFKNLVVIVHV